MMWIRDDGIIACQEHLDPHAAGQAERHPRVIQLFSKPHSWFKLNGEDHAEFMLLDAEIECSWCAPSGR
ncbi:hypothetical protein AA0Z99_00145 [Agrococcus sp. 1P02AA]|uniref:hypothetical protein n=1 Tax=Agrococcus sp. 1P02AA TaxID=3132259 RepID=UPI0039A42052